MATWKTIDDKNVYHIWRCDHCEQVVRVSPDFYQHSGEPVCSDCDEDMNYEYTEIMIDDAPQQGNKE